jgi:2-(1,2-epoxy-1,2-dihydrophenyl)acetyl-CoA isomerase
LEHSVSRLRRLHDRTSLRLHTMPKPTVALVNGAAAGAGMSLALACDIRLCSDTAKFVPAFARVGFSGDFGGSFFLQRLVGPGLARELYFLGEPIDAQRAFEVGIANHLLPQDEFLEKGLEFCARLAKGPTAAYGRMKANFNLAESSQLKELLDQEALNMNLSGMGRDFTEGTKAFVEKREPNFVGE